MGLDSKHPLYSEFIEDWTQMRDSFAGERRIKQKGFAYLSPTSGMVQDGINAATEKGFLSYDAYRRRARFPDMVKEAVKALLGVMHNKPATIELPAVMDSLIERATLRNESLQMLLRRVNEEQLILGRVGLLGDFIDSSNPERGGEPYIAMYQGERLINWDDGRREEVEVESLNLVVIDESEDERKVDFEYERVEKYRVLVLGDLLLNEEENAGAVYRVGVFRETTQFSEDVLMAPFYNGQTTSELPFVFINPVDIVAEPDFPPLLGLSNMAIGIYRGEADYRQSLFMQGQDTLVIQGGDPDKDVRVGTGATIHVPTGGDAKYIGVESAGLEEQRLALENDHNRGQQMGGQLLDSVSRERESGDALQVRVAARTATLNQIALAGAFGLQTLLRKLARWMGADPEQVIVTPNLDFVDDEMSGEQLSQFMGAKMIGAPLSLESIHLMMQQKGVTEKTLEEELKVIEAESELEIAQRNAAAGSPTANPEEDDDDAKPGAKKKTAKKAAKKGGDDE